MKLSSKFFLSLFSLAILSQCNQDADLLQMQSTSEIENSALAVQTATEEDCTTCPKLEALSLKYYDETVSSQDGGHFFFDLGIQNEHNQYNAIPSRIDVYNYTDDNEVINITEEPMFEQILTMAGIPLDTIINLLPLTNYTKRFRAIIDASAGAFVSPCRSCDTLYQWPNINYINTIDQNCISPDSLSYCLLGRDICTMLDIADSVTFSFYPQVYEEGVSLGVLPQKEELVFEEAFLKILFDKRLVSGDVNFDNVEELDTTLTLSECPIFTSNDNTIPSIFSMDYDFTDELFQLEAQWADNSDISEVRVTIIDNPEDDDAEFLYSERFTPSSNAHKISAVIPEIATFLEEQEILNLSISILAADGTINVVDFGLTINECLDR